MNVNIIFLTFILVFIICLLFSIGCFFYKLLLSTKNDINSIKNKLSKHITKTLTLSSLQNSDIDTITNCIIPSLNNSIKDVSDLHTADVIIIKKSLEDLNRMIDELRTKDKNDTKIHIDLNESIIDTKKSIDTLSTSYINDIDEIRKTVNDSVDKLSNLNTTSINEIKNKLQDSINTTTKLEGPKSDTDSQGLIENYNTQSNALFCLGGTCFEENDIKLLLFRSRDQELTGDTGSSSQYIIDEIGLLTKSITDIQNSIKNNVTKDDLKSGEIDLNINGMNLSKLNINDWKIYRDDEKNNLCILNTKKDNIICMDDNLNATLI